MATTISNNFKYKGPAYSEANRLAGMVGLGSSTPKPKTPAVSSAGGYNPALAAQLAGQVTGSAFAAPGGAVSPVKKITSTAAPVATQGTIGSYNGKPIYAGQDVASQMGLASPAIAPANPAKEKKRKGLVEPKAKPQPAPLSFGGLVGDVAGAARQTPVQAGLIGGIAKSGDSARQIGDQAAKLSEKYGAEIARVGELGAGAVAGGLSTGTNVVGSGNAAIASQSASSRMSALSAAQQAALEGTGQQLTAQGQQANALTQALGGANTSQVTTVGGLGSAAGLAAPNPASYGQTVFNPLAGGFAGGQGNLDPQTVAADLAQKVLSNQMTYEQAVQSLGYAGGAGTQFLNSAIQAINPGANIPAISSQVGANQANYSQFAEQEAALQQATSRADLLGANLVQTLQRYAGSNTARPINEIVNIIRDKVGDAQATSFKTALTEAQRAYGALVQAGGNFTPTGTEETASSLLSADMTGDQLIAALEQLSQAGKITLSTVTNQKNAAFGGGGGTAAPAYGGGATSGNPFSWD